MASPEEPGRERSPWFRVAAWLGGAFAVAANVVGLIEFADSHRPLLIVTAGAIAIVGAAVWLAREPRRRWVVALAVPVMVVGLVLIGAGFAGQWREEPPGVAQTEPGAAQSQPGATQTEPGAAQSQPGAAQSQPGATQSPQGKAPFTGTVTITSPRFGFTLNEGGTVSGEVTGWVGGYRIWLSARARGTVTEIVRGPCQVSGASFACSGVSLPGPPSTHEHITVAVLPEGVTPSAGLPLGQAAGYDQSEMFKG